MPVGPYTKFNKLLQSGVLGPYTPNHFNDETNTIGAPAITVGTGLNDLTSGGTYTADTDHVYTIVMQPTAYVIGAVSFSGVGLNDGTSGGTYSPAAGPSANHTYIVKIGVTGATDKFLWNVDGGSFSAPADITAGAITLEKGVTITFGATTGHTTDDQWTITVTGTDAYKYKKDSGSLNGSTPVTGAAQTLTDGVQVTFAATVGHTPTNQFTISVSGGTILTANLLGCLNINSVGNGAELRLYDGSDSSGILLYDGLTADWTAGTQIPFGFALSSGHLYVDLIASTTYPDIIIGTV